MNAKEFTVYMHTCPNGKVYIGMTSRKNLHYRFRDGKGYANNKRFTNAIGEYGWENIKHEIVFRSSNEDEACEKEIELIKQHKATDPEFGYNIFPGGKLSASGVRWTLSEEIKKKHRESAYWKTHRMSDEMRAKMSLAKKGKPAKNKKKVLCVETNQEFESVTEAAKHFGICNTAISNCLSGLSKKAAGHTWRCV